MEEVGLYVIFDRLAKDCAPLFEAKNDEVARRNVWQLLKRVPIYDRDSFRLLRLGTRSRDNEEMPIIKIEDVEEIDIDFPKLDELVSNGTLFSPEELERDMRKSKGGKYE